jgi:hypothetical protein
VSVRRFALEVVGGRHDGIRGMEWHDDGEHPPPDAIIVGTCPGDGSCQAGNQEWCRQMGRMVGRPTGAHPAYWTLDEGVEPDGAQRYGLTTVREEPRLTAVYVQAGVSRRTPTAVGEEVPLTVADILRAGPPAPVTALGRRLVKAARDADEFLPGRHDRGWPRG